MHALLTDRYQLTMLAAYARAGLAQRRAVFELFVRRLPASRRYLVACGIGRAVALLGDLRFEHADLAWLAEDRVLGPAFADPRVAEAFRALRFRGKVWAVPEGRVCFPGEPLVRVEGTLVEAQLVETLLLSIVNHDTRVASKCARIVEAAAGRPTASSSARGARTSTPRSTRRGRPTSLDSRAPRTRRPRVVTASPSPARWRTPSCSRTPPTRAKTARGRRSRTSPRPSTGRACLVDTFDTRRGVDRAIAGAGALLAGVRIDSGDLLAGARDAREASSTRQASRARGSC